MSKLPQVGGDVGNWGNILNDYLLHEHNADGTHRFAFDVKSYGAKGDGATIDTSSIQAAIDAAYNIFISSSNGTISSGAIVYLPPGTYIADGLVLKKHVSLVGAGKGATIIQPPAGSKADAVLLLDAGPVQFCTISDFALKANGNAGQHGIHFAAQGKSPDLNGGLWSSQFARLQINGFDGCGIWLQSGSNNLLINQFLTFDRVDVIRGSSTSARSLRITGQSGQITLNTCLFDGTTPDKSQGGYNIEIGREGAATGSPTGSGAPYNVLFTNCTSQNAQAALFIDAVFASAWRDGYNENTKNAILVTGGAMAEITGSSFTNAASDGSGGGWGVKVQGGSKVKFEGNHFAGAMDSAIVIDKANAWTTVIANSNYINEDNIELPIKGSNTLQLVAASTLDIGSNNTVIVGGTTPITTLRTHLYTGSMIAVKAHGSDITFTTGGNINLGTVGSYTLKNGNFAMFVRFDLGAGWSLVGTTP